MASIRKRGDSYTISVSLGYDEQGKQIRKFTTYTPPADVAAKKGEKLVREYATLWENGIRGFTPLDENKTLRQLSDWYFDTQAPLLNRPNVAAKKKSALYLHVMPKLGNVKIKLITPQMLDALFAELKATGFTELQYRLKDTAVLSDIVKYKFAEKCGISRGRLFILQGGGVVNRTTAEKVAAGLEMPFNKVFEDVTPTHELSASTVRIIKLALSSIFTVAVKKQICKINPCQFVTLPKVEIPPAAFLDEQQSKTLLDALHTQDNFQFEVVINLFLAAGLRSGELVGLHWEDVNLDTGVIYVRHTLAKVGGVFTLQPTKTTKSNRRIKLPPYIVGLLTEHKRRQTETIANSAGIFNHCGAVFTNQTGGYLSAATIAGQLKRICKAAGLPDIHLHTLRHTHASLLINSDIAAKVVADRLGHADTKTTLNIYTHIFEETETKTMQAVEMKLFQQSPPDGAASEQE
jgi:integrase